MGRFLFCVFALFFSVPVFAQVFCADLLQPGAVYFPGAHPGHATLAFHQMNGSYVIQVRGSPTEHRFVVGTYERQIIASFESWLQSMGHPQPQVDQATIEYWVRAGSRSLHNPTAAIVIRCAQGNFLLAPSSFDTQYWTANALTVLVDTAYPRILGYFPGKITLSLDPMLQTDAAVAMFESSLMALGARHIDYGSAGAKRTYNAQILVVPGTEKQVVSALQADPVLSQWVVSANQSTANAYSGQQKLLFTAQYVK